MNVLPNIHLVAKNGYFSYQPADYKVTDGHRWRGEKMPHSGLWLKVLATLRKIGFKVTKDPRIEKMFPTLSATHRYGKWRDLEVNMDIYPTGFKLEFYQNLVTVNCNGGRYDFDKFEKMPYLVRKQFLYTVGRLDALIAAQGQVTRSCQDEPEEAAARLLFHFQTSSFTRDKIQGLAEIEGLMSDYDHKCNSFDRDKNIIKCGTVKYYRDHSTGRLMRGVAYHNINNMWWVITSRFTLRNIGSSQLFDPTPADYVLRRSKRGKVPAEKQAQLDLLNSISSAQLAKALARANKRPQPVAA